MIPDKCASEKRNIEEVRHKIKVSNHSATRLERNLAETNLPNQGHCILSVANGDHAELPNQNLKNLLKG